MGSNNRTAIRRTIESIVLISVFFLASTHSISMAKPQLIKIDKGTKSHQHHVAHKTSSKAKPKKSSNAHNTHHSNHSQHAHHLQHTKTASSKSGSKHSRPKQSKTVTKHQSAPQHARAKSITTPQTTHQRTTTHNKNRMTEQHGAFTLLKTDQFIPWSWI